MNNIVRAIDLLRAGGLVAFPTETVYGLGADATNPSAIRKIFAAKGRPPTNPLIVHVADEAAARQCAAQWPANAARLAKRFWPGPLTLVVPRHPSIALEVTAGRHTVGLRAPDHPLALELLRGFGGPVAAPSANRSMRISPTTADHVREELQDSVDLILDGGPCRVGIESTVLDLSGDIPTILRPGAITAEQIEAEIGPVEIEPESINPTGGAKSPGRDAVHYSPRTPTFRFERAEASQVAESLLQKSAHSLAGIFLGDKPGILDPAIFVLTQALPSDPQTYARRLYAVLREADESGASCILVEMPPDEPRWLAVRDRLRRASKPWQGR